MYTYLSVLLNCNEIENKTHILYSGFGTWDRLKNVYILNQFNSLIL